MEFNSAPGIASRVASIEVIDEFGDVVSTYGPYENAITDGYAYSFPAAQNGTDILKYAAGMGFFTGVRYPLKRRGVSTATISGNILNAPGLIADYGVDVGLSGYVNQPSLTGKVIKFDSGEEYYISGVSAGNIILRNGQRIKNLSDSQLGAGGFYSSNASSWFFPTLTDLPTPTNYTIWDVGNYNYTGVYSDQSPYGEDPSVWTSTSINHAIQSILPSRTGIQGVYSGIVVMSDKFETATIGSNLNLGKLAVYCPYSSIGFPFAHVNIGGNIGINVLAGQKLRATYETVFDFSPMFDTLTGIKSTPLFSGMPTSSGFFTPYLNSQPSISLGFGVFPGAIYDSNFGDPHMSIDIFNRNITNSIYAIFNTDTFNIPGSGVTPFSPSYISNPSISLKINPSLTSVHAVNSTLTNNSGTNIFIGGKFYRNRHNFTATVNDWNGQITGLFLKQVGAFWFYQSQTKAPEYELSFSLSTVAFERKLIN